jgi:hypothetical protein
MAMLVFVDESEWPSPKRPDGYTVWAAVALNPRFGKEFFRQVFNLEKKFWKVSEPYEFEIKGRLLLSRRGVTSPKKLEFTEELLSLCKRHEVQTFAVGMRMGQSALPSMPAPNVFRVYHLLLERVEQMMVESHPDEMAVIAFDSQDEKTDRRRALEYGNFLYGHEAGKAMNHVVDTPYFVSSAVTVGIQIADLIAYALAQANLSRGDELRDICNRIREMEWRSDRTDVDFPLRGFRFLDVRQDRQL